MLVPFACHQSLRHGALLAHHRRTFPHLGRDDRPLASHAGDDQEVWEMASRVVRRVFTMSRCA